MNATMMFSAPGVIVVTVAEEINIKSDFVEN